METVSDINKKKRGRPAHFIESEMVFKKLYPDIKTSRGLRNKVYQTLALGAIGTPPGDPALLWLWNRDQNIVKQTILAELGRCHPDDIVPLALEICNRKMKSVEAVSFIRQNRGVEKPEECRLEMVIIKAINRYIACYPDCTYDEVHAALDTVRALFAQQQHED